MTAVITLKDIGRHPVVERQWPLFDAMELFPTLTQDLTPISMWGLRNALVPRVRRTSG